MKKLDFKHWRYRLMLLSERKGREVFSFSMPVWLTAMLGLLLTLSTILLVIIVMTKTPLRQYLPGYLDVNQRAVALESALRIDSLEHEGQLRDAYLANVLAILTDKTRPVDSIMSYDSAVVRIADTLGLAASDVEKGFVSRYEERERFGLNVLEQNTPLQGQTFVSPVMGTILLPETEEEQKQGTPLRVLLQKEVPVLSPFEVTVIARHLLIGEGWELVLQSHDDYVFIFSHLTMPLVQVGQVLKSGQAIGHAGAQKEPQDRWLGIQVWHMGRETDPRTVMQLEK